MGVLKSHIDDWVDLGIPMNGEYVLNYHRDDNFILTKVKAHGENRTAEVLQRLFTQSLGAEVSFANLVNKTFVVDDTLVDRRVYSVEKAGMKYAIFDCFEVGNKCVTMSTTVNSVGALQIAESSIPEIVRSLNLEEVLQEYSELQDGDVTIRVCSPADVQSCRVNATTVYFVDATRHTVISLCSEVDADFCGKAITDFMEEDGGSFSVLYTQCESDDVASASHFEVSSGERQYNVVVMQRAIDEQHWLVSCSYALGDSDAAVIPFSVEVV